MKVLIINPPMNMKSTLGEYENLMEPSPPIGLAYICSVIESRGYEVKVIDSFAEGFDFRKTIKMTESFHPDVIGLPCFTISAKTTCAMASELKKSLPESKIIMGNIHASLFDRQILSEGHADIIAHGEAEITMSDICDSIQNKKSLSKIPGISYRNGGKMIRTRKRETLKDIDSLPYPAWNLFPYKRYGAMPFADIKHPIIGMIASRGCPFNCAFCSLKPAYRERKIQNVIDEAEYVRSEYGARQIAFMDLIFPRTKSQGLRFSKEFTSKNLHKDTVWITQSRVDIIDFEVARAMKKAGCRRMMFGIESGSQRILDLMRKGITTGQIRRAVRNCRRAGLPTVGFFIIGYPGETLKDIRATIRLSNSIGLDFAKFAILTPYPGSEVYNTLISEGKIDPEKLDENCWESFSAQNPDPEKSIYVPDGFTAEEIIMLEREGNRKFYMNPRNALNVAFKMGFGGLDYIVNGAGIMLKQSFAHRKRQISC